MESELIDWLARRATRRAGTRIGIGDDAAVLAPFHSDSLVIATDTLMDGVDFELPRCDPRRAGRKCLAVNLSDLAAMAARPQAALVSLVVPRRDGLALARELYEGLLPLADRWEVDVVGGDTNSWDGPLVVSVTVVGRVVPPGPWLRRGGQVGDVVLVTGTFGGSILGRHLDFEPRVDEALAILGAYEIHAAIDVSDGLTWDLMRVCRASGCGAVLDPSTVPIDEAAHRLAAASGDDRSPLEHALGDGEDFELILVAPPSEAERLARDQPVAAGITPIGRLVAEPGLWQAVGDAPPTPLTPRGYQH